MNIWVWAERNRCAPPLTRKRKYLRCLLLVYSLRRTLIWFAGAHDEISIHNQRSRKIPTKKVGIFRGGILCQSSNLFRAKLVSSAPTPVPAKLARVQPEKPSLELFFYFPRRISFLVERVGFSGWFSSF